MAFSLKKAVLALYQRAVSTPAMRHPFPLVDPNNLLGVDNNPNAHTACALTGMLPLHVAVVNGVRNMFDFLIDLPGLDVPAELSLHAQRLRTSSKGTWTNLTPLGLATVLGDQRMFQHIMRRRARVLWKWGPVTNFQVTLEGIDSAGDSDNDVMELLVRGNASQKTQSLLDECVRRDLELIT